MPTKHHGSTGKTASNPRSDPAFQRDSVGSWLYLLRSASARDTDQLTKLEQSVFPTLWPPTNFTREIKKSGQKVLVVSLRSGMPAPDSSEVSGSLVERVVDGIRTLAKPGTASGTGDRSKQDPIAGWTVVWFVVGEAHIASIGVAGSDRRRGVGELLVQGAIEAAAANDCDELTLEVRRSNEAAQALYRKYGFRVVGERKGYYIDDNEDALIMTTPDVRDTEYAAHLAELSTDHARRWEGVGSRFERE